MSTPDDAPHELSLDPPRPVPNKAGVFTFVSRNGEPLYADDFRPSAGSRVKRFIAETLSRAFPGAEATEHARAVRRRLEKQFTAWAVTPPGTPDDAPPELAEPAEVDVSRVVRPELFHTPAVSGLTVPVITGAGDKLTPRWRTYLRWAGGRREAIDRPAAVPLPGGAALYVHPDPGEPAASEPPAWSAPARKAWRAGEGESDPAGTFRRACDLIARYLEFDPDTAPGTAATLALWTVLTYVYPAWDAVPYLYVGGPMGSGKSRVLDVLARLAFRPLVSANLTAPALFRTLHARGGTLLYDEAERLRQDDMQELTAVFLAGYKRGAMATRLEPVGDSFRPVQFEVYGPKVLACIAGLPPTLASRCIAVMMFRAAADSEKPKRRPDAEPGAWARLRDELHALALDHGPDWLALAGDAAPVPAGVSGRNFELWQPLLALAQWFERRGSKKLLARVQRHALASVQAAHDDAVPEADETLLDLLAEEARNGNSPTAGEVLLAAKARCPGSFDKWHATTVGRRFKTYGIPLPKKSNGERRYPNAALAKALKLIQERYGIDLSGAE